MMSEMKLQAAASVMPVRAMSWNAPNSAGWPVTPKPRARAAAEMMREMRLQAAASVKPVRAMSCTRA